MAITFAGVRGHGSGRSRRGLVGLAAIAALLAAGVISIAGTAPADVRLVASTHEAAAAPASTTYTDPQGRFTIVLPPGWTAKPGDSVDSGVPGIVVFFFPPPIAGNFQPNINVLVQRTGTTDAVTVNRRDLRRLEGYTATVDKPVTLRDGSAAHAFGGTFTYQGFKLRNVQLLAASKSSTLVVTGTALESQWPTYGPLLENSLETLTTTTTGA